MGETLRQLGGLLLGSIPTIIFMAALYGAYFLIVHKPLTRVLAERHLKTQGAMEKAHADIAAAETRTAQYEHRLREARLAIFKTQEARRQQALATRSAAVAQARARARSQVEQACAAIESDKQKAETVLQAESQALASEIIRTILEPAVAEAGGKR